VEPAELVGGDVVKTPGIGEGCPGRIADTASIVKIIVACCDTADGLKPISHISTFVPILNC
jgi:hypothetical protein